MYVYICAHGRIFLWYLSPSQSRSKERPCPHSLLALFFMRCDYLMQQYFNAKRVHQKNISRE